MDFYTRTHQYWLTSKNLHLSVLCWHWVLSRGLSKSDGDKWWERESRKFVLSTHPDDDDDDNDFQSWVAFHFLSRSSILLFAFGLLYKFKYFGGSVVEWLVKRKFVRNFFETYSFHSQCYQNVAFSLSATNNLFVMSAFIYVYPHSIHKPIADHQRPGDIFCKPRI